MSDNWLTFVPRKPEWKPGADVTRALELARASFPRAEEIDAKIHDAIQFIDQGANFEDVLCPLCGASLLSGFEDLMDEKFDSEIGGFSSLDFVTPCCGKPTSLNDLDFVTPAAFASFQLDIMNPGVGEVPAGFCDELEGEFETPLKAVWCHI